jgi:hypothetical protein
VPLLFSCADQKGPAIRILIAHAADAKTGRCIDPDGTQPNDEPLTDSTMRISIRAHAPNDPGGSFLCDRVFHAPTEQPYLRLSTNGIATVDIYAEMFRQADMSDPTLGQNAQVGPFRRVASGQLLGLPVDGSPLPILRLFPTQSFRCVADRLHQARAFHSATLLPDGEVLFVGGVSASPDPNQPSDALDGNDHLFLTGTVEVWSPATGKFTQVTEPMGLQPRAFHQAALLNDIPPYQILLVGGITSPTPASPVLAPNQGATEGTRFAPFDVGTVPVPLPIQAASAEVLTFTPDPTMPSATWAPAAGFAPGAFQAGAPLKGGIAVAGGIDYTPGVDGTVLTHSTEITSQVNGGAPNTGMISTARVGATLSPLYGDTALVWGGGRAPMDPAGDLVTGLTSAAPKGAAVMLATTPLTQFHTATVFTASANAASVLVTGGFTVGAGAIAMQPPAAAEAARVLSITDGKPITAAPVTLSGYSADPVCMDPARYRPAGWESATLLPSGQVLVTGGSPTFVAGATPCNDCEMGGAGLLCSLDQASLFIPPSTLAKLSPMQVGRYGHSSTLLSDGTVLIAGGLNQSSGAPRTIGDAEIYNPRGYVPLYNTADPATPDADDPLAVDIKNAGLARAPGDVARDPHNNFPPAKPCGSF